jgi:hypothetical protein
VLPAGAAAAGELFLEFRLGQPQGGKSGKFGSLKILG